MTDASDMSIRAGAGPLAPAQRALAPDLARGAMLLLIALANAHLYLFNQPVGPRGYPAGLDTASQRVTFLQTLLVDGRAYPMFGLLFGYGIVQMSRRFADPGAARRLVRRRGWIMVLLGALHGILLWAGDIVGAYGLLSVMMAGLLTSGRDRWVVGVFITGVLASGSVGLLMALPTSDGEGSLLASIAEPKPALAVLYRCAEYLSMGLIMNMIVVFGAVAFGGWAARRRVLDAPAAHLPLLRKAAAGGLVLAVACGLPLALMTSELWTPGPGVSMAAGLLHMSGGYAGGIGYAALFGLLAVWLSARPEGSGHGVVVGALVACGQRSLTCYLAQSVVFVGLFSALGFGLGSKLSIAWTSLLAFGTWLVILLTAAWMSRHGIRGPAEVVLRRLTYRTTRPK